MPSDRHLEAYARQQGFPSYAAMVAFYKAKSQPQAEPQQGGLGGLGSSLPMMHPKKLFEYVLEKYRNATGT